MGYEELIGMKDYISIDSPIAQVILKKQEEEDDVVVNTPAESIKWRIHKYRIREIIKERSNHSQQKRNFLQ